jgi:AmmeMemoRadiSam system protein B
MKDNRPSPIAGSWYPGNAQQLIQSLDQQLASASFPSLDGEVIGVIAPHAGHRYSGGVAAHAFRVFAGLEPEIVAVLSPLHTPYQGEVFSTGHSAYSTPLGDVLVDHDLINTFESELGGELQFKRIRHDQEHSLEIELPFLQRVLSKPFKLLPLMILKQTTNIARLVGDALGRTLLGKNAVLVASSDLSHFYPAAKAEVFDRTILDRIEAFDPEGVVSAEEEGAGFACGRGAIAAALWAGKSLGADQAKVLSYAHSGAVTGDMHSVVGYGAAVLFGSTPN